MNAAGSVSGNIVKPQVKVDPELEKKEIRKALCIAGVILIPILGTQLGIWSERLSGKMNFGWLSLIDEFFSLLALYLVQYIYYGLSTLISYGQIFILPTLLLGLFFYLILFGKWKWLAPILISMLLISLLITPFLKNNRDRFIASYQKVEAYIGQSVSKDQFLLECGEPAFYKPVGQASHWAYTNGQFIIPVRFDGDVAIISDNVYHLFD